MIDSSRSLEHRSSSRGEISSCGEWRTGLQEARHGTHERELRGHGDRELSRGLLNFVGFVRVWPNSERYTMAMQLAEPDKLDAPERKKDLLERKEILVAKSVVEEVRKRVMHFKSDWKAEKEKEKDVETRVEEKSRAAAWAWYEHGNSAVLATGGGTPALNSRSVCSHGARKASRFKTEALKVTCNNSGRVEPRWDFESSLFDTYELNSVSKQIDCAFQESQIVKATSQSSSPITRLARSSSLRGLVFPRSLCRSISDVVTHEEMALGLKRCECSKDRVRRTSGGWSFRKLSKALHVLMHVPASELSHQGQRTEHLHDHYHHHHLHDHEHHHHHHYSVKMKDGEHYGKSHSNSNRVKPDPFPGRPQAR